MEIYISGRQFGKTTMLIQESAQTGATIAVATYPMARHVEFLARKLNLKIPTPVTYAEIFRTYREGKTKRYLVDELQMMLSQLNIDICTLDYEPVRYLNHWSYPNGYSPRNLTLDEQEYLKEKIQKLKMEKFKQDQMDKLLRAVEGEDDETR